MDNTIYWYTVRATVAGFGQTYLFKSDHLYEVGDRIVKRYGNGVLAVLRVTYAFGSACPAHIIKKMQRSSAWPPILSDI